jgi:hypothetical protein
LENESGAREKYYKVLLVRFSHQKGLAPFLFSFENSIKNQNIG